MSTLKVDQVSKLYQATARGGEMSVPPSDSQLVVMTRPPPAAGIAE